MEMMKLLKFLLRGSRGFFFTGFLLGVNQMVRFITSVIYGIMYSLTIIFMLFVLNFGNDVWAQGEALRCATIAPEGSEWARLVKESSDEIEKKIGVKVIWYLGGMLGDEPEIAKKVKNGNLDCAGLTGNGLSYLIPAIRVLELPFMFREYKEVDFIKEEASRLFRKIGDDYNVKFIWLSDLGPVYIFSNFPIRKIDDVNGKVVWVWKGDYLAEYLGKVLEKRFSIKILPVPLPDVKSYLDKIEIFYNAPYALVTLGWEKASRYYITPPLTFSFISLIIRRDSFDKIPAEKRPELENIMRKYLDLISKSNRENNYKTISMLEKGGLERINLPKAEIEKAEEIFKSDVWAELKDKLYPSWLLTQILTKLSEFRAK